HGEPLDGLLGEVVCDWAIDQAAREGLERVYVDFDVVAKRDVSRSRRQDRGVACIESGHGRAEAAQGAARAEMRPQSLRCLEARHWSGVEGCGGDESPATGWDVDLAAIPRRREPAEQSKVERGCPRAARPTATRLTGRRPVDA